MKRANHAQEPRRGRRVRLCANLDRLAAASGAFAPAAACWEEDPGEPAQDDEALCQTVRVAVAETLTEKQRQVVELYFFEGLSQGEIAQQLGITQQVVHKRLHGTLRGGRHIGGALPRLRLALLPLLQGSAWVRS